MHCHTLYSFYEEGTMKNEESVFDLWLKQIAFFPVEDYWNGLGEYIPFVMCWTLRHMMSPERKNRHWFAYQMKRGFFHLRTSLRLTMVHSSQRRLTSHPTIGNEICRRYNEEWKNPVFQCDCGCSFRGRFRPPHWCEPSTLNLLLEWVVDSVWRGRVHHPHGLCSTLSERTPKGC